MSPGNVLASDSSESCAHASDGARGAESPFLPEASVLGIEGCRDLLNTLEAASIVSVASPDGTIVEVNEQFCKVSGYSRAELIGRNHRIVNSGLHPRSFWKQMYRTVASGGVWKAEVCNRAKNGELYWVDSTVRGFFDDVGRLRHIVSVRTDITALKNTLRELQAARDTAQAALRTKHELLANVSHELRTPLTSMLGYADLILDNGEAPQMPLDRVGFAQSIRRSGQHLLSLINELLELSRLEAGRVDVHRLPVNPMELLREVRLALEPLIEAKEIKLTVGADGPLPVWVLTDPAFVRKILLVLGRNAIKFTECGAVRVMCKAVESASGTACLQFDVEDTGIGIDPGTVERLFEPFVQADAGMSRRFGGMGLGLAISRRLARALQGEVVLVRTKPGAGTTFRCTVPALESDAPPANACDVVTPHGHKSRIAEAPLAGRVLLAEDGPDNQRLIAHVLRRAGATVTVVDDGRKAMDAALGAVGRGEPFDLILMDMQMPDMDGYEATALLRERGYAHPIVALTAHSFPEDREKCLASGCDEYASKPIDRAKLVSLCAHWMAKKPRRSGAE